MRGTKAISWWCHILSANLADFLSRTRVKALEAPRPEGLVVRDLTRCLPTCLKKKLAELHGYFLPSTPRKTNAAERLKEGAPAHRPQPRPACRSARSLLSGLSES